MSSDEITNAAIKKTGDIMRFLVDLYRWLILLIIAAAIIGCSWFAFSQDLSAANPQRVLFIYGLVGAILVIVLGLGITATFISIHDRIAEIADQSRRIADVLERGEMRVPESAPL